MNLKALLAVAIFLFLPSCGISVGHTPQVIASKNVPFGLLSPSTTSVSTTTSATKSSHGIVPAEIFLIKANHLSSLSLAVPYPLSLQEVLDLLVAGPTSAEVAAGFSTAIPSQTRVSVVSLPDIATTVSTGASSTVLSSRPDTSSSTVAGRNTGVVTINLNQAFSIVSGQEEVLAVAQLVYTATSIKGINGVSIELDGQPTQVPQANGTLTPGPLTRADFS
ncbi:MAG: GerMN domain-containing protein [Actinobacteria bacterium]|jgi:hypothetical protein|nr:GerMN domain-containing protein [Actinomycetota bacterium]MCL6104701.1 GerMN domain-containing protein [Actinomycetota bacterium]